MKDSKKIALFKEFIDECGLIPSLETFLCSKGLVLSDISIIDDPPDIESVLEVRIKDLQQQSKEKLVLAGYRMKDCGKHRVDLARLKARIDEIETIKEIIKKD